MEIYNKYIKSFVDNTIDSITNTSEEEDLNTFNYPSISDTEQTKINSINNFIGVYCPMGYYKIKNDGSIKIIPNNQNTSTDYSNTLSSLSSSNSGSYTNLETFSNINPNDDLKDNLMNNYYYIYKVKKKKDNNTMIYFVILFILIFYLIYFN